MKANLKALRKQRTYSEEFKRQVVQDFESGQFSVLQLEKLHGISNVSIYNWIYKFSTFNEKGSRIVEMKDSSTQKLKALQMAIRTNRSPVIHYSDRGSQYTYGRYIDLLKANGTKISMALSGLDNAYAERINRTIKEEYLSYWKPKHFIN
ncbi:MAG: transposase [Psychroflexus halocasei]|uniref:transposase n=1 Tax=Psychroflexus sp. S27 TaxID=1982757 RepID=UPI000C2AE763|nr:transposase [Psychroflexus sp. S27]PJX20028.1 hypothetical protein CAP47_12015 [Psychroflexus sp. S27]